MKTFGYAAQAADTPLAPFAFVRRELRLNDVATEILQAGAPSTQQPKFNMQIKRIG